MTQMDRIEAKLDRLLEVLEKPQKPQKKAVKPVETKFDLFWKSYPRKVGKANARKTWNRHKLDDMVDNLIEDVQNRITNDAQWSNAQYIPHPTTYLNGERWKDELTPKPTTAIERIEQHEQEYLQSISQNGSDMESHVSHVRSGEVGESIWSDGGTGLRSMVTQPLFNNP